MASVAGSGSGDFLEHWPRALPTVPLAFLHLSPRSQAPVPHPTFLSRSGAECGPSPPWTLLAQSWPPPGRVSCPLQVKELGTQVLPVVTLIHGVPVPDAASWEGPGDPCPPFTPHVAQVCR